MKYGQLRNSVGKTHRLNSYQNFLLKSSYTNDSWNTLPLCLSYCSVLFEPLSVVPVGLRRRNWMKDPDSRATDVRKSTKKESDTPLPGPRSLSSQTPLPVLRRPSPTPVSNVLTVPRDTRPSRPNRHSLPYKREREVLVFVDTFSNFSSNDFLFYYY